MTSTILIFHIAIETLRLTESNGLSSTAKINHITMSLTIKKDIILPNEY